MGELLGTNRGFELNDVTQFSTTGSVKLVSFGSGTGAKVAHSGTYGATARTAATDVDWTDTGSVNTQIVVLTTNAVNCNPGLPVTASFWQIIYQDSLPAGGHWGTRTMAMVVDFYDAADGLISSEAVTTGFPTSSWGQKTGTVTAPATTTYCKLKVTYTIPCYVDEPGENVTIGMYISVDDFSISVPLMSPQMIWF